MTTREDVEIELKKVYAKLRSDEFTKHFKGWNKTMQYHFTDDNTFWHIRLIDGKPEEPKEGQVEKPEIGYSMSSTDFLSLMRGEVSGMKLYTSGKLKVKASMGDLMKLQKLN